MDTVRPDELGHCIRCQAPAAAQLTARYTVGTAHRWFLCERCIHVMRQWLMGTYPAAWPRRYAGPSVSRREGRP